MSSIQGKDVRKLIVACDAGMGSSVMLASTLRRQLKGTEVTVDHTPVNSIPGDADVVVCHAGLADRARASAPGVALVPFQVFIGDPAVTRVVDAIRNGGTIDG
ncbi:PTS lactose transporter subunit IIB [Microbispora sp. H10670]|uniref:PTS lactose transporter subunit IIB n=1 Tax=Microbispora sp. H10670 TaxID=2729108 RepID=UPI001603F8CB|nr:PTS lactose transporter subunit IIB [Microbispora sp. H10670]